MENFTEKTQYFLRENTSGREDNACRFSCEFAKEGMIFCFDVRDEDIISPFTQDNEDLWRADAVEVFLSPNGDLHNYKEIEVSPFGVRFYGDIYNSDGKTAALTKKTPAYQAWAEQTDGGYSVKIVIGYDSLEGFDRAKMKLNAYRLDKKQSGEQLLYALNPTMCGSFHRPQYFIGEAKKMKFQDREVIVFAGDSVTDADKYNTGDRIGTGYVKLIRDALTAFEPQNLYKIVNAGISGDNSADLLARWDKDVDAYAPDTVFCMIGINDVWRHFDELDPHKPLISEEDYEKNLREICKRAKKYKRFFLITPYFLERNRQDEMRMLTERYVQRLYRVAEENGVPVLDAQKAFDEYMLSRAGQSISWDRVHPGPVGSMILARLILKG